VLIEHTSSLWLYHLASGICDVGVGVWMAIRLFLFLFLLVLVLLPYSCNESMMRSAFCSLLSLSAFAFAFGFWCCCYYPGSQVRVCVVCCVYVLLNRTCAYVDCGLQSEFAIRHVS
jgi:hypothetical protein